MNVRREQRLAQALPFALILLMAVGAGRPTQAQVVPPDREEVFRQDTRLEQKRREELAQEITKVDQGKEELDVQAPQIEFRRETNEVVGRGGFVMSQRGVQVQADEGIVNTETKQGKVSGNVVMTTPEGTLTSTDADLNMDSETGTFSDAQFTLEQGGYDVIAARADKLSEFQYQLEDSLFSTCHCADGDKPWKIDSSSCNVTQEGYAHCYNTAIEFQGVPVFYSPYFAFPVKTERASGLLVPKWGMSSRDGFKYSQPLFMVVDDQTDFTLTPFIETRTREGASLGFRRAFSRDSDLEGRVVYSNEARRNGELRGIDISGLVDPTFDDNRYGGFYYHRWRPRPDADLPMSFIADVHLVSDDLFLREIEDGDIGAYNSRYTTSIVMLRGRIWDSLNTELRGEYNQAIEQDDDFTLQRLPEMIVSNYETYRPFGYNQYGLKLVTRTQLAVTDFARRESTDGWRADLYPRVGLPFHVENFFRGQVETGIHQTQYSLRDRFVAPAAGSTSQPTELEESQSRTVPFINARLGTELERVFDVDRDGWFAYLTGLGVKNESHDLTRLKHTIEPLVTFSHIPDTSQEELPFWDPLDRIRERTLVGYGVRSRIYGRFLTPYQRSRPIGELTPSLDDLGVLSPNSALGLGTSSSVFSPLPDFTKRDGEIRELVSVGVRQSYDFKEAEENNDPLRRPLSDITSDLTFAPSPYLGVSFDNDFNTHRNAFDRYGVGLSFFDDRGDVLRTRYSYVDGPEGVGVGVSQLEGNLELKLTEQLRLGYYGRFDDVNSEILESKGLLRFMGSCRCWSFDVGVSDRTNPDKQQVLLTFTFAGLGDITQDILLPKDEQNTNQ